MADYRQINAVYNEMYARFGGMMTLTDIAKELGNASRDTAKKWLVEHDVPGIKVGVYPRWETRLVAKKIVSSRGYC